MDLTKEFVLIEDIQGFWYPKFMKDMIRVQDPLFMQLNSEMHCISGKLTAVSQDLVFFFNRGELAVFANHYKGIAPAPNAEFRCSYYLANDGNMRPDLRFRLVWIGPEPPKEGEQILLDYGYELEAEVIDEKEEEKQQEEERVVLFGSRHNPKEIDVVGNYTSDDEQLQPKAAKPKQPKQPKQPKKRKTPPVKAKRLTKFTKDNVEKPDFPKLSVKQLRDLRVNMVDRTTIESSSSESEEEESEHSSYADD